MRTLTAIALAITMLAGVTAAQATTSTSTTHKKHKKQHHSSSTKGGSDSKGTKDAAPAK
jgi:hypothetical protein